MKHLADHTYATTRAATLRKELATLNQEGRESQMQLVFWNIEGLRNASKDLNLESEFSKPEVFCFVETLNSAELPFYYKHEISAKNPPRGRPIGGICVLARNDIPSICVFSSEQLVKVKIGNTYVICCYFAPNTAVEEIIGVITDQTRGLREVILVGDFNCKIGSQRGTVLVATLEKAGLKLENDIELPTYICHNGKSVIDLVFVAGVDLTAIDVVPLSYRKHMPLKIKWHAQHVVSRCGYRRLRYRDRLDASKLLRIHCIPDDPSILLDLILESLEAGLLAIKHTTVKKGMPWFDQECRDAKRGAQAALQCSQSMVARFGQTTPECDEMVQTTKRKYKQTIRWKRKNYEAAQEALCIEKAETENIYSLLRTRRENQTSISKQTWTEFYTELFTGEPSNDWSFTSSLDETSAPLAFTVDIDQLEVEEAVSSLRTGRAPGEDGITAGHLKQAEMYLAEPLTALIRMIWGGAALPLHLMKSVIKVVYKKKGARADPASYRPIALLGTIRKVLAAVIHRRLSSWAHKKGKIPVFQHGFCKGRSTITALQRFLSFAEAGPTYALFIDYTKCFDLLSRAKMLARFQEIGISGRMLNVLAILLQTNFIRVLDNQNTTAYIRQQSGIQQGDVLSPLLFILYTSDQPTGSFALAYADDVVLAARSTLELGITTQSFAEWSKRRGLIISLNKTKAMAINARESPPFCIDGQLIETVTEFTYLGFIVQKSTAAVSKQVNWRCKQMKAAVAAFNSKHRIVDLEWSNVIHLYKTCFLPILTYAMELYIRKICPSSWRRINATQVYFLKKACALPIRTPTLSVKQMIQMPELCCCLGTRYSGTCIGHGSTLNKRKQPLTLAETACTEISLTDIIEITSLKGINRRAVANFAVDGFHYESCSGDPEHDIDGCILNTYQCKLCNSETNSKFHLLRCNQDSLKIVDISTIRRITRLLRQTGA